jgi:antitoxin component of MazEF toxin-antitoxin module
MTGKTVTRVKFVSTISKMGDKRIIVIPKDYHKDLEKLSPRQVKVTIDDEI